MVSYFEHNKLERGGLICSRIEAGETCALVTDAGMPAISDPGELLVAQAGRAGPAHLRGAGPQRGCLGAGGVRAADGPL